MSNIISAVQDWLKGSSSQCVCIDSYKQEAGQSLASGGAAKRPKIHSPRLSMGSSPRRQQHRLIWPPLCQKQFRCVCLKNFLSPSHCFRGDEKRRRSLIKKQKQKHAGLLFLWNEVNIVCFCLVLIVQRWWKGLLFTWRYRKKNNQIRLMISSCSELKPLADWLIDRDVNFYQSESIR